MNKRVIIEKWNKFVEIPFPIISNESLMSELVGIDTFTAGCISSFIDGNLDQECINILKSTNEDLSKIQWELHSPEVKKYFEFLAEMVKNIITLKSL